MVGSMMDEDQLANMLSNPHVAQQMNEMMNNDTFIDMMIQSNPMLRNNPNARDIVRSPLFRQMMTSPDALRGAARLQRAMGGRQAAQNAFPMPGVTDNTPGDAAAGGNTSDGSGQPTGASPGQPPAGAYNPFDPTTWSNINVPGAAGGNAASNPFGAFFNPFGVGQPGQAAPTSGATPAASGAQAEGGGVNTSQGTGASTQSPSSPPPNPFASLFGASGPFGAPGAAGADPTAAAGLGAGANPFGGAAGMSPELLQQMMQMLGVGSPAGSPAPQDNRPPEERWSEQLLQLNEMGFYDFDRNVEALRRSGGSIQGAIEYLLSS